MSKDGRVREVDQLEIRVSGASSGLRPKTTCLLKGELVSQTNLNRPFEKENSLCDVHAIVQIVKFAAHFCKEDPNFVWTPT